MKPLLVLSILLVLVHTTSCSQNSAIRKPSDREVGGGCDGCVLMYEGMPSYISWQATFSPPGEPGEPLIISGTIYKKDGHTPAPGIILYCYHTDSKGYYSPAEGQVDAKRHGHLRGWVKSDAQGRYQFKTIRPASYPGRKFAAHIHPSIKEPGLTEYYIDEYLFEGDPFLTPEVRSKQENRGGSGIIKLTRNQKGEWIGHRDIMLGLNIPGY